VYADDQLLSTSQVSAQDITDNQWIEFVFPKTIHLYEDSIHLKLEAIPVEKDGKVSAWLYSTQDEGAYIERSSRRSRHIFAAKYYKTYSFDKINYKLHSLEPKLRLIENLDVLNSGYFLPELSTKHQPDFESTQLLSYHPTDIALAYNGVMEGWLILPIRFYPGWQAYVNDAPVVTSTFLDMMPAIAVKPGDQVNYRYEPKLLFLLVSVSVFTLLATLGLTLLLRNK
jgi:uncharacterized membrane protein YfhO